MNTLLQSLKSEDFWMRLLYFVIFYFVFKLVVVLILIACLFQMAFLMFCGKINKRLNSFSSNFNSFLYELASFLTFTSDHKPFPFSDWPSQDNTSDKNQPPSANKID